MTKSPIPAPGDQPERMADSGEAQLGGSSWDDRDFTPEHDPLGTDLAIQLTQSLANVTPRPNRKKVRRSYSFDEQRSGSHPDERDPQLVGEALTELIQDRGWTTQLTVRTLLEDWAELVGATCADHCSPESFTNSVLVIRTDSTAWATQLRLMAGQVISTINTQLGVVAVKRIEVLGPAPPSWKHGPRSVRDGRGPRDTYG